MRVAIVHDWLVSWRGGEKVLEAIASLYPDAPIFTLFSDLQKIPEPFRHRKIIVHEGTNRLRFMRKALLPWLPVAIESFDLSGFDLVISTSSCVAKGVLVNPAAKHLCYIHSPMRYIWDQRDEYLGAIRRIPLLGFLVDVMSSKLRIWDMTSSTRVDLFVANSTFVKHRVMKYYGRKALVVSPPVDVERFSDRRPHEKKDYFLAAGAFVRYKRFDLAIAACEAIGRKLIVAGSGPDLARLKALAGPWTTILDSPDDTTWARLMKEARGFIFPGVEDFGITGVEALAAGTPVIALRAGGALDFVIDGKTGVFFDTASKDALCKAIQTFETSQWDQQKLVEFAATFDRKNFLNRMQVILEELLDSDG